MKVTITTIRKKIIAQINLRQLQIKTNFKNLKLKIAYNNARPHQDDLYRIGNALSKNGYGQYILSLIKEKS